MIKNLMFAGLALFILACNNENKEFVIKKELSMIDSLDARMTVNSKLLDIDYPEIAERMEEMAMDQTKMRMTERTFTPEIAQMMDRYVNIGKTYNNFYEPFKKAKTEEEAVRSQLIALRESVNKQEYGKDKFKEYYQMEKDAVSKLENFISQNIQPILDVEMEYRRIQSAIDQHLYGDELDAIK